MKLVLLSCATISLISCVGRPEHVHNLVAEAPLPPTPLKVQVSVVWSLEASTPTDVTIKGGTDWKGHGACYFDPNSKYLLGLFPITTSIPATPTVPDDYVTAANAYIQALNASSNLNWSLDLANAQTGHCWNNITGVWEDCLPTAPGDPPKAYAFPLKQNGGSYFDHSKIKNPSGTVNIVYYVLVQLS